MKIAESGKLNNSCCLNKASFINTRISFQTETEVVHKGSGYTRKGIKSVKNIFVSVITRSLLEKERFCS